MDVPPALLAAHPQLAFIAKAIAAYREGDEAVSCPTCAEAITVVELPEVGVLETGCSCGYCHHRLKWDPKAADKASDA
jgi:hypothetical protein